ncbi:MAG: hypothetical protein CMJ78_21575 [Planctomycetaceae bacterium]|nr:hypothetical protein [Planctomycetaceae bacterium]
MALARRSIQLPQGKTLDDVVEVLLEAGKPEHRPGRSEDLKKWFDTLLQSIAAELELTLEDAHLAMDAFAHANVCAIMKNPNYEPDPIQDPIAHLVFQKLILPELRPIYFPHESE